MRKKQLYILLEEAENNIQHLLKEKEEVVSKLQKANEIIENNEEIESKNAIIDSLNATINELKAKLENNEQNYNEKLSEANAIIDDLNKQINDIKGELFDTKKCNDDLKIKVEYLTQFVNNNPSTPTEITEENTSANTEAPQIHAIDSIETSHKEAYDYGSKIISQAILRCSSVKNDIVNLAGPMTEELLTLCLGKVEMLKSAVLQTILEDVDYSEKTAKMDNILKDTYDYFESILGQIK